MQIGNIVISLSGHDKGRVSVVVKAEQGRVWIADGKQHTLDRLKSKNPKHLQLVGQTEEVLLTDAQIRRCCKRV